MALSKVDYNSLNVTAAASKALKWNSSADGFETGDVGGSLVLLETQTASSSATISFTSNIDSTYDEYVFKFYDIHPATDETYLSFNFTIDGTNWNVTKTSTAFRADHNESDSGTNFEYWASQDLAQGTGFQSIGFAMGNDNDQATSGELKIYAPSSTTFVKHFVAVSNNIHASDITLQGFVAGYGNTTSAATGVQFKMNSGNIDAGTFKLYGVT